MRPPLRSNPYLRIKLNANPFQIIDDPELLKRIVDPTLRKLAEELAADSIDVIEILGERGWGKSTLLQLIRAEVALSNSPLWAWSYIPPERSRVELPKLPFEGWIIDEAQRLNRASRRDVMQHVLNKRLILGTHESYAPEAKTHNRPIRTVQLAAPTIDDLQAMLAQRVDAFAVEPIQITLDTKAAELALRFSEQNRRTFEELLFEVFYQAAQISDLPATISEHMITAAIEAHAWS